MAMKANKALAWLAHPTHSRVSVWCAAHSEHVWLYRDGSWSCRWQLIVETSDESECEIVDEIPKECIL